MHIVYPTISVDLSVCQSIHISIYISSICIYIYINTHIRMCIYIYIYIYYIHVGRERERERDGENKWASCCKHALVHSIPSTVEQSCSFMLAVVF